MGSMACSLLLWVMQDLYHQPVHGPLNPKPYRILIKETITPYQSETRNMVAGRLCGRSFLPGAV